MLRQTEEKEEEEEDKEKCCRGCCSRSCCCGQGQDGGVRSRMNQRSRRKRRRSSAVEGCCFRNCCCFPGYCCYPGRARELKQQTHQQIFQHNASFSGWHCLHACDFEAKLGGMGGGGGMYVCTFICICTERVRPSHTRTHMPSQRVSWIKLTSPFFHIGAYIQHIFVCTCLCVCIHT